MKSICLPVAILLLSVCGAHSAPIDNKDNGKNSKSAFGPAFDEIVVESSLTVRRKTPGRQGRNQNVTEVDLTTANPEKSKTKREISLPIAKRQINHRPQPPRGLEPFGGSAANSQGQAFNSFGPLGTFGASSTGAQTQGFLAGPDGLSGSAGFSGSQQYMLNGQTIDIAFGNTFSGANGKNAEASGAAITITGPDGKKRPFSG